MEQGRGSSGGAASAASGRASGGVSAGELAELMSAFTAVTGRLEQTHEVLRQEVARLQGELHRANEQIERSRRLAALGEMAAGIAHEIRNPLGSIRLYAAMLEEDLADRPKERSMAGKIAAAVRGLNGVVGDVLSFARELRVAAVGVGSHAALVRAAEAAWFERANGVEVVGPTGPDVEVAADAELLHQALVNVVRNALEAMTLSRACEGGHRLALEVVTGGDGFAGLVVSDTGDGLSAEVVERMFNPFFTTRAQGTGLGLAIVHRILDAHGGRVVAGNVPQGRGARVELWLPRWGGAAVGDGKVGGLGSEWSKGTARAQEPRVDPHVRVEVVAGRVPAVPDGGSRSQEA